MKRIVFALTVAVAGSSILGFAQGQGPEHAAVLIPDSSIEHAGDRGAFAHTNHLIRIRPDAGIGPNGGVTPSQIRGAYNLPSTGGSSTIYIVDAFHYPTALSDFNTFSSQFGLPTEPSTNPTASNAVFQVRYATKGNRAPRTNCGWAQEAALDIEWAHAMAPNAKIVLVEAASNSFADLMAAVDLANGSSDAREVSMSWGGSEFSSEATYDSHFNHPGNQIVYTAASGDTGGITIYPGVSPYVVAAGGTRLTMNGLTRVTETGWSGSGGGKSKYEPRPSYQDAISSIVGSQRGVPDWSFDADPATGVSVYDSTSCQGVSGWLVFGGTSVSAPALAGIINTAGNKLDSLAQLSLIYLGLSNPGVNFFDITSGTAGSFTAMAGWDFVTGIGSTNGTGGK